MQLTLAIALRALQSCSHERSCAQHSWHCLCAVASSVRAQGWFGIVPMHACAQTALPWNCFACSAPTLPQPQPKRREILVHICTCPLMPSQHLSCCLPSQWTSPRTVDVRPYLFQFFFTTKKLLNLGTLILSHATPTIFGFSLQPDSLPSPPDSQKSW